MSPRHAGKVAGAQFNRNVLWTLAGMVLPLPLAVFCIQPLLRGLGEEQFGILVLVWMAVTFVAEIGFGRAASRFSADAVGRGAHEEMRSVLSVAVRSQVALGFVAAVVLSGLTLFTPHWLGLGREPGGEVIRTFLLVSAALPLVATASAFRGVLEATQQFRSIAIIAITVSVLAYAGPVVALELGAGLFGAVACILAGRIVATLSTALIAYRLLPEPAGARVGYAHTAMLLRFAGWSSVSSIVSPALLYIDRAMLAAFGGVAALAWYAPGHEVISRALLIPSAFTIVLFSRLSALTLSNDPTAAVPLTGKTLRQILIVFAPIALVLLVAAPQLLGWWLGAEFAAHSTAVVRILLAGAIINAAASVPFTAVQAAGRADIPAKFHAAELVIQLILSAALVSRFGAIGAALAWTIRICIDAALLFVAARRLQLIDRRVLLGWADAEKHAATLATASGGAP